MMTGHLKRMIIKKILLGTKKESIRMDELLLMMLDSHNWMEIDHENTSIHFRSITKLEDLDNLV